MPQGKGTYGSKKGRPAKKGGKGKSNLFDNIRKRKAAGKKMRKPGEKGAPSAKAWNTARKGAKKK